MEFPAQGEQPPFGDGVNRCVVRDCDLPGGHHGPHEDSEGKKFSWEPYGGRVNVEPETDSSSSDESDELIPDGPATKKARNIGTESQYYVLEIPLEEAELDYLSEHPKRATAWLAKKMENKGKELRWSQMPLSQKKEFDEAQCRELSQVMASKAVRSLTAQEELKVDRSQVMAMRWVMTLKGDGTPKARLVVLGYQQHNLTSVQASAPTMSRISRNLILTICATLNFLLSAGDVSAAFLQAAQSLEGEDLYVWAPAELAVLFGACPDNPMKILKICKAFYGLVHAPRKWFDHVASTMEAHGWMRLLSDRCVFVLHAPPDAPDAGRIVGVAGLHVDDFLIGGDRSCEYFLEAEKKLKAAYRWGKWQQGEFTFAGCDIKQHSDMSISINQKSYVDKWLEECVIDRQRADKKNLPLTNEEISQLRGILGTLAWKASQTGPPISSRRQFVAIGGKVRNNRHFAACKQAGEGGQTRCSTIFALPCMEARSERLSGGYMVRCFTTQSSRQVIDIWFGKLELHHELCWKVVRDSNCHMEILKDTSPMPWIEWS